MNPFHTQFEARIERIAAQTHPMQAGKTGSSRPLRWPSFQICLCFVLCPLFGSLEGSAQVPNGSFENWTDCEPTGWASGNVCGVFAPITKSSTAQTGSFAARGEVINFFGQSIGPVLQSGAEGTGFAISERFASVEGSHMFQPVGGDRFGVNVAFYKDGKVVAQGAVAMATSAPSYTPFKVIMNYVSQAIPDNAVIQIMIVGLVTGSDFHLGSVMFVDAVSFGSSRIGHISGWLDNRTGSNAMNC